MERAESERRRVFLWVVVDWGRAGRRADRFSLISSLLLIGGQKMTSAAGPSSRKGAAAAVTSRLWPLGL